MHKRKIDSMQTPYETTKKYNEKRISEGWIRRTFFYPEEIIKKLANSGRKMYLKHRMDELNKKGNE
jgi:hypothetical protein